MSAPHIIGLAGPWELAILTLDTPPRTLFERRIKLPGEWLDDPAISQSCLASLASLGDSPGLLRCLRRFGQPTGLEDIKQVHLVLEGGPAGLLIRLNGAELGRALGPVPAEFDVAHGLLPRNTLSLEFSCSADSLPAGAAPQARLEIEA